MPETEQAPQGTMRTMGDGKTATPNSYQKDFVKFYPNDPGTDPVDIKDLVKIIEVQESLTQTFLVATLNVLDGVNFLETYRVSGNERIDIKLSQTAVGDSSTKKSFEKTFRISDVINHSRPNPGSQTYQFRLVSEMAYINQLTVLDRAFQDSLGGLIKKILKNDLRVDDDDIQYVNTATTGIMKGIYPNLRPINAIIWLMRNAYDQSTPFYFYETFKHGVMFASLVDLASLRVKRKYEHKPYFKATPQSEDSYLDELQRIRKVSSDLGMTKFNSAPKGAYASELTTIDIATKEFGTKKYEYKDGPEKLNKNKPFPTTDRAKFNGRKLSEHTTSKRFFSSLNSKSFPSHVNYHGTLKDNLQKGTSIRENFKYMSQELELNGDFGIYTGAKVELTIPKSTDPNIVTDANFKDKIMSGLYFITGITHTFNMDEYRINIIASKDSSLLDLDGGLKL